MTFIKPPLSQLLPIISTYLNSNDRECYFVGGYVRDYLLNRPTADVDLAVTGDALEVAQSIAGILKGKYILLDCENAIARVVVWHKHQPWHLDFSSIRGNNIVNDLKLRDLTINAMAVKLPPVLGTEISIIDPCNGLDDLTSGRLKAVSDESFKNDPARLLRTIRLGKDISFSIEEHTEKLISRDASYIANVAAERVHEELLKLSVHNGLSSTLRYMDRLNLLPVVIPELDKMKSVEQPGEHYWDVFNHSMQAVAAAEFLMREGEWPYGNKSLLEAVPWTDEISQHMNEEIACNCTRRQMLKFGTLFHDIAKPSTKKIDENGRMRFLGHTSEGAEIAAGILHRLRFSTREIKLIERLVYYHLRPVQMSNSGMPSSKAIYRYFKATAEDGIDVLFVALADFLATCGPNLEYWKWREQTDLINYILAEKKAQDTKILPEKIIDGSDVMSRFGLTQGPLVGKLLNLVHEAQAAGEVANREDAFMLMEKELLEREQRKLGSQLIDRSNYGHRQD